ncbi:MAG: aspartyl protease family protein [Gemmatimonadales bacterium]
MTEFPGASDHLAVLAELDVALRHHDLAYWVFGGWAVDFHAGRVTREHGDIDIAIWSHDRVRTDALLRELDWAHRPEVGEDGYTCYERNGTRLEVAFLASDERGEVYTPLSGGRGEWPSHSFGDKVAHLHGVRARVVGRDSLIADKSIVQSDSVTAAKDRADVITLLHRHGSPEPPFNACSGDLATFLLDRGFVAVPLHPNAVGHFELAAEVNGHAARLVLDTGASQTVFATASAERLGLLTTPSAVRASGVASDHATATTTVAELRLGTARLQDLAARTFDLGHINRALAAKGAPAIDGAIGGDVLRPTEAVIDYARATLYLRGSAVTP